MKNAKKIALLAAVSCYSSHPDFIAISAVLWKKTLQERLSTHQRTDKTLRKIHALGVNLPD
ncbi:MAG TPA: hypothetical protein V6C65_12605 [Allocoleopsis sp.]